MSMKPASSNYSFNLLHSFLVTLLFSPSSFHLPLPWLAPHQIFSKSCHAYFVPFFSGLQTLISFGPKRYRAEPENCFCTQREPLHVGSLFSPPSQVRLSSIFSQLFSDLYTVVPYLFFFGLRCHLLLVLGLTFLILPQQTTEKVIFVHGLVLFD